MKKILGLDLGTNSIGWALVEIDDEKRTVRILGLGSRILSMDAGEIKKFESGAKLESKAAQRTTDRGIRKLNERYLLRRDRLHCVLNLLNALPKHYRGSIEFETPKGYRSGKFKKGTEPKIAYVKDDNGKYEFLFKDSYQEMLQEFKVHHPNLLMPNRNGKETNIPFDWTLYYLRVKALKDAKTLEKEEKKPLTLEELAWVLLSFNQKRGYEKTIGEDEKEQKEGQLQESFIGRVESVSLCAQKENTNVYEVVLIDPDSKERRELFRYNEESKIQVTYCNDLKEVEEISKFDDKGNIQENKTEYTINEIHRLKVEDVKFGEKSNQFEVLLETGWQKIETSKYFPKWKDKCRDFIIKTKYDSNGNLKGASPRSIKAPEPDDWILQKLKTDTDLSSFNANNQTKGVAGFIYSKLLTNPTQKIKGDLITVVDRKYYREELEAIFNCQKDFHDELQDGQLFLKAITLLYPHNETHRRQLEKSLSSDEILPFSKLVTDDVLLYQRDLKSKKSLIANCNYESRQNNKTKEVFPIKVVPKSHPLFQEFRIWQFIKSLKIYQLEGVDENGNAFVNKNVTEDELTKDVKEELFGFLNNREHITQSVLLKHLFGKTDASKYKWNYEEEHKEPCNETRYNFILRINRVKKGLFEQVLSNKNEYKLWHFFYSVKKQEERNIGIETLLANILRDSGVSNEYLPELVKNFKKFAGYSSDYGSFSEKALKKLLPFLRIGKYWSKQHVEEILGSAEHEVKEVVFSKEGIKGEIEDFQGLWISSACYLVYGRYSEVGELQYWKTPYDIENYLRNEFKQHSLNNPVVEKVLVETLNIVSAIWKHFGKDGIDDNGKLKYKKVFDQIHIELGREMKKNMKERQSENSRNKENQKANERIIELLKELKKDNPDVKPKSRYQQDRLRIIENDLLSAIEYDKDATKYNFETSSGGITKKEIKEFVKKDVVKIKRSELERYKLWLEQRYQSPYTGRYIKLSDLFNREKYEIEHIFPQERITLNAMCNKVISETEVNKAKGARTGYQFILEAKGKEIFCNAHGGKIRVLGKGDYESRVKANFNGKKLEILLNKEIPSDFTSSQLNNARYISKMAMKLLSNIVREEGEDTFRSKNVLPVTGQITTILKKDWQLNDAWNRLIQPRFERLNELTSSNLFGDYETVNGHRVFINRVPEELEKDFDKKRIDHRHHAMDALTVALTTQSLVNYLNNVYSSDKHKDSASKLIYRQQLKNKYTEKRKNKDGNSSRYFLPPAQEKVESAIREYLYSFGEIETKFFHDVVFEALQHATVSFKQKNRIIRQRSNKYRVWNEKEQKFVVVGQGKLNEKVNYNVRQKLHKDTFYGNVKLRFKKEVSLKQAIEAPENIAQKQLRNAIQAELKIGKSNEDILKQLTKTYKDSENIDFNKVQLYYWEVDENGEGLNVATRFNNSLESFAEESSDKIEGKIKTVTDNSIQKILSKHLEKFDSVEMDVSDAIKYIDIVVSDLIKTKIEEQLGLNPSFDEIEIDGKKISKVDVFKATLDVEELEGKKVKFNPQLAFSQDGIKDMNNNIVVLNEGKKHKPIYKVRLYQKQGKMFPVSKDKGEKNKKIVETAGGSGIYCGVYENLDGSERKFYVPTLRTIIQNLREGASPCPQIYPGEPNFHRLFILSPNDLVYVPTQDEIENNTPIDVRDLTAEQKERIYKFRDGNINDKGIVAFKFMPSNISTMIYKLPKEGEKYILNSGKQLKGEVNLTTVDDKSQNTIDDGIQIRKYCIKLKVDRLGNITGAEKG